MDTYPFSEDDTEAANERKLLGVLKNKIFGSPFDFQPPKVSGTLDIACCTRDVDDVEAETAKLQSAVDKLSQSNDNLMKDSGQCETECYTSMLLNRLEGVLLLAHN